MAIEREGDLAKRGEHAHLGMRCNKGDKKLPDLLPLW
jgi:hypothetical protein